MEFLFFSFLFVHYFIVTHVDGGYLRLKKMEQQHSNRFRKTGANICGHVINQLQHFQKENVRLFDV